jgi:hypothetical protein
LPLAEHNAAHAVEIAGAVILTVFDTDTAFFALAGAAFFAAAFFGSAAFFAAAAVIATATAVTALAIFFSFHF